MSGIGKTRHPLTRDVGRGVMRAIVDHDDAHDIGGILCQQAIEAPRQERGFVVGRDDNRQTCRASSWTKLAKLRALLGGGDPHGIVWGGFHFRSNQDGISDNTDYRKR